METPEVPVHLKRRHMGDEVERIAHEVSVEDRDGRGSMSDHRMRQCGEVGSLPVVHPQLPGRMQQRTSRDCHPRVVSESERPGLPEICHGQLGGRPYGGIIKACCVTVDECEGA